ncbi:MAG: hypothetical protein KDD64_11395 [Bdellovibrionales bacterium]|nr:hypothetical protein [Bdellovibrionales bacterium]
MTAERQFGFHLLQTLGLGLVLLAVCLIGLSGCDGGSRGTGTVSVDGRVLSEQGMPQSGIVISDINSGSSDVSGENGEFFLSVQPVAGRLSLAVDTPRFSDTVEFENLDSAVSTIRVMLTVVDTTNSILSEIVSSEILASPSEEAGTASPSKIKPTPGGSDTNTPKPSHTPSSGGGLGEEGPTTPTPSPTPTPLPGSASPTPTPSETPEPEEVEEEGILTQLSLVSLTVDGITFTLDAGTQYLNGGGDSISYDSLELGDRIRVYGVRLSQVITADLVVLLEEGESSGGDDHHQEEGEDVEGEGRIETLTSSLMRVDHIDFTLTPETRYLDHEEHHVTLEFFRVNDRVHVVGVRSNGQNLALSVKESG